MPTELSIDIETYSGYDLKDVGVYKYVEHPDFDILLLAYAFDNGPVSVVDLASGEDLPDELVEGLKDDNVLLCAHNAAFERVCLRAWFKKKYPGVKNMFQRMLLDLKPERWACTMVHAAMVGLPMALGQVAAVLKLEQQKDTDGKALIRFFCGPQKIKYSATRFDSITNLIKYFPEQWAEYSTDNFIASKKTITAEQIDEFTQVCIVYSKTQPEYKRNMPSDDPEKWARFKAYCIQDVEAERAVHNKVRFYVIPETERQLWFLDQRINDAGIRIDQPFVRNAIEIDKAYKERLTAEARKITGLGNPNSPDQLKSWLEDETGLAVGSLTKESVVGMLKKADGTVKRVLEIRQELSKTSIKKYPTMLDCVCADGRARGTLQFYGASRTGRWAGRLIQIHNLPRVLLKNIDLPRELVADGRGDMLELLYDGQPDNPDSDVEENYADLSAVLSQLIRTSFISAEGKRFIVTDFKQGEARIISWLADEQWRIEVFNTHGKIYEASAAQMFNVPFETVAKGQANYSLRQRGKVAELALGFGGGANALEKMDTKKALKKEEYKPIVTAWRKANSNIVQFWRDMEAAAIKATKTLQVAPVHHGITFHVKNSVLFMTLPSGRMLSYLRPTIHTEMKMFLLIIKDNGSYTKDQKTLVPQKTADRLIGAGYAESMGEARMFDSLSYEGVDPDTKQWGRRRTYGGELVENCVQGTQRDWLAFAMLNMDKAGYNIVLHVHDETGAEMPEGQGSLAEVERIMSEPIPWAPGLPLGADGFESKYYKK